MPIPNRKLVPIGEQKRAAADEQIKTLQKEIKYDLRDFTIDYLVKSFREDLFFIPTYQREFIWPTGHRSKFVESVILGLPIPMLFVADMADGRLEIVDGAQRIQTLEEFMSNDLPLAKLELLTALQGFRFSDLSVPQGTVRVSGAERQDDRVRRRGEVRRRVLEVTRRDLI